jgi:5-methylthioadenosine/S-adenosylhomocysteine deaminase
MVNIAHPAMQPLYDPVRSMVYAAGERAVRHVFVGGQQVVRDGKALAFDYADATARLEMAQRRAIEKVPRLDWAGRSTPGRICPQDRDRGTPRGATPPTPPGIRVTYPAVRLG